MSISSEDSKMFSQNTYEAIEHLKITEQRIQHMMGSLKGPLGAARMSKNPKEIKDITDMIEELRKSQRLIKAILQRLTYIDEDIRNIKETSDANAKLREEERKRVDANKADPRGTYRRQKKLENQIDIDKWQIAWDDESPKKEPPSDEEHDDSYGVEPPSDDDDYYGVAPPSDEDDDDETTADTRQDRKGSISERRPRHGNSWGGYQEKRHDEKDKRQHHGNGKGPHHGNGKGSHHGNGKGSHHGNGKGPRHGNGNGQYHGNSKGQYHGNGKGPHDGKGKGPRHGNGNGQYHGNSRGQYHGNGNGQYHGNSRGQYHGNGNGQYHGNGNGQYHGRRNRWNRNEQYCDEGDRADERRSGGRRY